jgi:four helix bundle protein
MNSDDLKKRTKQYALRIIKLIEVLPKTQAGRTIGNQLIRSGTSIGANYRSALRGRSKAEFIAKLGIVIEEADESEFWLELIVESKLMKKDFVKSLLEETNELIAIFVSTKKTSHTS